MANELIPTREEMESIAEIAKQAVESNYVSKLGGYAGVFSIAIYARELGIPVMSAIFGGVSNIMGKITLSPQMMNSMIRKAGHKLKIECTDLKCTIEGTRNDTGEACSVSFSVEDARKASLVKTGGAWEKYPSDMCFARCLSRLARRMFPDVIGTAYVEGEIEEEPSKNPLKNEIREVIDIPRVPEVISLPVASSPVQLPTILITEEQADELEAMLVHIGGDYRANLLSFFKVEAFRFLPMRNYETCLRSVNKRRALETAKEEKPE